MEFVTNIDKYLNEYNFSGIVVDEDIRFLLKRMMTINPELRISPTEILEVLKDSI